MCVCVRARACVCVCVHVCVCVTILNQLHLFVQSSMVVSCDSVLH